MHARCASCLASLAMLTLAVVAHACKGAATETTMRRKLSPSRRLHSVVLFALVTACNSDRSLGPPARDLIACPLSAPGGDLVSRGFYIDSFPGTSLKEVHLWFSSNVAGTYQLRLTAQHNTFAGSVIGTTTATVTTSADPFDSAQATFTFSATNVPTGEVVAFSLVTLTGAGGSVFFAVFTSNASCPVTETEGTSPPLDAFRRAGIAIRVTGA